MYKAQVYMPSQVSCKVVQHGLYTVWESERESETTVGGPRKHHNVLCSTKIATLSLDYRSEVVQVVRLPSDNPETRFRMHLVSHQIRVTTSRHCSHKVSEMSRNCLSTSVDNPTDIPAVSPECVLCRRSMLVREVISTTEIYRRATVSRL